MENQNPEFRNNPENFHPGHTHTHSTVLLVGLELVTTQYQIQHS